MGNNNDPRHLMAVQMRAKRIRHLYFKPAIVLGASVMSISICTSPHVIYTFVMNTSCPSCANESVLRLTAGLLLSTPFFEATLYAVTESGIRKFYLRQYRTLMRRLNLFQ